MAILSPPGRIRSDMSVDKPSMTIRTDKPKLKEAPGEMVGRYVNLHKMKKRSGPELCPIHPLTGEPYDNDSPMVVTETFRARPLPRDANVPPGYERRNGYIVPERPQPPELRFEGQHPDDNQAEHKVRMKLEFAWFSFLFTAAVLLAVTIGVVVANVKGVEMPFPIGFLPLPFFIWALVKRNKLSNQLSEMKRERAIKEAERLMNDPNVPQGRATVTVTR